MSQPCAIPKCERMFRAPCDCCKKNLCLQHLYEHNTLLVSQLNLLADEVNAFGDRLNRINLNEIAVDCRKKLEELRIDAHKLIDNFFEQKCQELNNLITPKINEQQEKMLQLKMKLAKLIHEQEATQQDIDTSTSTIRQLDKNMNKIAQTRIQVNTHPLRINDNMVQFEEIIQHQFDSLALSSIYTTIIFSQESSSALTSNGRLLLVNGKTKFSLLNTDLKIVKQIVWPNSLIYDMCWSSKLYRFIVIVENNIFLVDENIMSIIPIQTIKHQKWLSCTCFNNQLFVSTGVWGSSIVVINLSSPISIVKEWTTPETCAQDEMIDDIVYNNETLALVIRKEIENSVRMELRSCQTLDRLWFLPLNIMYNKDIGISCCSLGYNEWLVVDFNAKSLLHITADGKIKQTITYQSNPCFVTILTPDIVVISTRTCINLHKIPHEH